MGKREDAVVEIREQFEKANELFLKAEQYLDKNGWEQGWGSRGGATCFLGAISMAGGAKETESFEKVIEGNDVAARAIAKVFGIQDVELDIVDEIGNVVPDWNDSESTRKRDVIRRLRRCRSARVLESVCKDIRREKETVIVKVVDGNGDVRYTRTTRGELDQFKREHDLDSHNNELYGHDVPFDDLKTLPAGTRPVFTVKTNY